MIKIKVTYEVNSDSGIVQVFTIDGKGQDSLYYRDFGEFLEQIKGQVEIITDTPFFTLELEEEF